MADGAAITVLIYIPARFHDLADKTVMNEFHVADQGRAGAALRPVLNDATVFFPCGYELSPFIDTMRERLLHIDILSGLARPDCRQRMPVVGRGDGDGIDFLIVERLTDIFVFLWRFPLGALDNFCASLQNIGIYVAERHIFGFI